MYPHGAPRVASNTSPRGPTRRTVRTPPAEHVSAGPRTRPITYHEAQPGSQARIRRVLRGRSRWGVFGAVAVLVSATSGCVSWRAQVPLVAFDAERAGTKMLRPGTNSTACCTRILGMAVACTAPPLDTALRDLLAVDAEANALTTVVIETRTLALGVLDRTCVTVHANVVRTTSVVRLPAPAAHEGHH